jgi:uncharacterized LabA/DUF88 family protein
MTKYLFIDGGYARERYREAMNDVFGNDGDLCPRNMIPHGQYRRCFYYDCLDAQKPNETTVDYALRTKIQETYFGEFQSLPGVHVRLGKLIGQRPRQKEVDIMLAVDMLTHGFNRNMSSAVLLAGDLDFRPVVDALVRAGIFVQVEYVRTSIAKELYTTADYGIELNWHALYNWSSDSFKQEYIPPETEGAYLASAGANVVRRGSLAGRPAAFLSKAGTFILRVDLPNGQVHMKHADRECLDRYCLRLYGRIEWED